jgi:hypothetical protein
MKSIKDYCKPHVPGWLCVTYEKKTLAFLRKADDIQVLFTMESYGLDCIKAVVMALGTPTEELAGYTINETPSILKDFFGDRGFAMAPSNDGDPITVRRYFSLVQSK